jgi:hypothetical protein
VRKPIIAARNRTDVPTALRGRGVWVEDCVMTLAAEDVERSDATYRAGETEDVNVFDVFAPAAGEVPTTRPRHAPGPHGGRRLRAIRVLSVTGLSLAVAALASVLGTTREEAQRAAEAPSAPRSRATTDVGAVQARASTAATWLAGRDRPWADAGRAVAEVPPSQAAEVALVRATAAAESRRRARVRANRTPVKRKPAKRRARPRSRPQPSTSSRAPTQSAPAQSAPATPPANVTAPATVAPRRVAPLRPPAKRSGTRAEPRFSIAVG